MAVSVAAQARALLGALALGLAAGLVELFLCQVDDAVDKGLARVALIRGRKGLDLLLLAVLPDDGDGYVGQGHQRNAKHQQHKRAQGAMIESGHSQKPPSRCFGVFFSIVHKIRKKVNRAKEELCKTRAKSCNNAIEKRCWI